MTKDKFFQDLVEKMNEVSYLPPQRVGVFTPLYKKIIPSFKTYPWKAATILSLFASVLLYLLLGQVFVQIASILQFGF